MGRWMMIRAHRRWTQIPLIVALASSLLVLPHQDPASATTPGSNGRIAFERHADIWTMGPDGSDATRLVDLQVDAGGPVWEPDGARLAYTFGQPIEPGYPRIAIVRSDGAATRTIPHDTVGASDVAWSPDGTRLAFIGTHAGSGAIYTVNVDGSGLAPIWAEEPTASNGGGLSWSPDGSRLAFTGYSDTTRSDIFTIRLDGTGLTPVVATEAHESNPTWAPDGTRMALRHADENGSSIMLVSADGSAPVHLTDPALMSAHHPSWSPDGSKIAFEGMRHLEDHFQVMVVDIDGGGIASLTASTASSSKPDWSAASSDPPAPVSELKRSIGSGHVTLSWENPDLDYSATVVRMVAGVVPPSSATSGISIIDAPVTSVTKRGLVDCRTYAFAVFVRDPAGFYSSRVSTTARPLPTDPFAAHLVIATSASTVTYSAGVAIKGRLIRAGTTTGVPEERILVQRRRLGGDSWTTLATRVSSAGGYITYTHAPTRNVEYRLVHPGSRCATATASRRKIVHVRPRVDARLAARTISLGQAGTIRGTVLPVHRDEVIYLQQRRSRTWRTIATRRLGALGEFRFYVRPTTTGEFIYRVFKPADHDHAAARSGRLTLKVSRA